MAGVAHAADAVTTWLADGMFGTTLGSAGAGQPLCADEAFRVRQGANPATAGAILAALASDPAVTVRAAVAMNPAAPRPADVTLSQDEDERVRIFVAQRLARLLPGLPAASQHDLHDHVLAVLATLVQDAATRVRAAISEAVKTMADAPRDLVLRLAHDQAVPVSDPVIRLSPVLTDADLLALLATPPNPSAPASIANRPGLSATLADAVLTCADSRAIRALLANGSATVRDATLNAIIAHAQPRTDGTPSPGPGPGPGLSAATAAALDEIVRSGFLHDLLHHAALAPAVAAALQARVEALNAAAPRSPTSELELVRATRQLHAAGALTEAAITDAARRGDIRRVTVQLAIASGLPVVTVDRAAALHNTKAMVSIVWLACMPMRLATLVQTVLGQCPPAQAMAPDPRGDFPMTEEEMRWQLDLLRH